MACSTTGYNYHAVSAELAMICGRNQTERCRARVVVRKTAPGSSSFGWIVQGYLCHYTHSHEKHPNILKNPDWRPTVKLVKGFDEAKAAALPYYDALNISRTLGKSRHSKEESSSQGKKKRKGSNDISEVSHFSVCDAKISDTFTLQVPSTLGRLSLQISRSSAHIHYEIEFRRRISFHCNRKS